MGATTPADIAAAICGIRPATLRDWRKRAQAGDERYQALDEAMERAESRQQQAYLRTMERHAQVEHRACSWLLERTWPDRWGPKQAPAESAAPINILVAPPDEPEEP